MGRFIVMLLLALIIIVIVIVIAVAANVVKDGHLCLLLTIISFHWRNLDR